MNKSHEHYDENPQKYQNQYTETNQNQKMAEVNSEKCPHPIFIIMTGYIQERNELTRECASYNCRKMVLTPLELVALKFEVYDIQATRKKMLEKIISLEVSSIDRDDHDDFPTELERLQDICKDLEEEEVAIKQQINESIAYKEALETGTLHEFYLQEEEALNDFLDDIF